MKCLKLSRELALLLRPNAVNARMKIKIFRWYWWRENGKIRKERKLPLFGTFALACRIVQGKSFSFLPRSFFRPLGRACINYWKPDPHCVSGAFRLFVTFSVSSNIHPHSNFHYFILGSLFYYFFKKATSRSRDVLRVRRKCVWCRRSNVWWS